MLHEQFKLALTLLYSRYRRISTIWRVATITLTFRFRWILGRYLLDQTIDILVPGQCPLLLILLIQQLDDMRHRDLALDPMLDISEHLRTAEYRGPILDQQLMIMLHLHRPRSIVGHPISIPLKFDQNRAVIFLPVS